METEKYSDVIDQASQLEMLASSYAIEEIRGRIRPIPVNTSKKCWSCGEKLNDTRRFCDRYCADDWEKSNK